MPVNVIGTLKPKNNGKFPVAEAVDIKVTDDLRLDEALEKKADLSSVNFALDNKADKKTTTNLQSQINEIITPVTQDAEVHNARVGADGTSYQTLKDRLDTENGILNTELDHIEKGEYLGQNLQFAVRQWNIVPLDIPKYTQFELLSDIAREVYTLSSTTSASSEYRLDHITLAANTKAILNCTVDAVAIGFYGDGSVDMKYSTPLITAVEGLNDAAYIQGFELGGITFSATGWTYTNTNSRVRTKKNTTITLRKGDIIGLTNYTDAKYYLCWRKNDDTYHTLAAWKTSDYVVQENGEYVVELCNRTERTVTDITDLTNLFFIKKYFDSNEYACRKETTDTINILATQIAEEKAGEVNTKFDNYINFNTKGITGESNLASDIGYVYPVKGLTLLPDEKYSLSVVTEDLTGQINVALRQNGTTIKTFPVTLSSNLTEYNTTFTVDDELENVNIGHYCGSGVSGKVTTTIIKKSNNSTIPDYYKDHIESKIAEIRQNMQDVGRNGETFVFITDVHWESNTQNSPSLISELLNKLNINLILCGGDLINQNENKALMAKTMNECVRAFNFKNTFFPVAFGNHDNNSNGISVENQFSSNDVYALMQKQAENHITYITTDKFNYYFDISATKTRFIVVDTGTNGSFNKYDALINCLIDTPTGYHIVIVAHWLMGEGQKTAFANNLESIVDAFNAKTSYTYDSTTYDFSSVEAKINLVMAGHVHYDTNWVTTGGVPFVLTDCDCGPRSDNTDYPYVAGTITEQCFDVVTVDYDNQTVKCVRIGRGSDRTINY